MVAGHYPAEGAYLVRQGDDGRFNGGDEYVLGQGIRLSMDGKGRATDNAFIERLWRNVKYEKIYLNPPKDGMDLYLLLAEYFDYYNHRRRHQSIDYETPANLYQKAACTFI